MTLPYQPLQPKRQQQEQQQTRSSFSPALERLKGLPFWIWDKEEHRQQGAATNGQCCWNHVVGLPTKDKREFPLFDYEKILYDSLLTNEGSFKDKHLWVKKATGLGITEFMLRMMTWLCTSNDQGFSKSQMCIVTGPNIEMATKLIKRMKGNFRTKVKSLLYQNKETVLRIEWMYNRSIS